MELKSELVQQVMHSLSCGFSSDFAVLCWLNICGFCSQFMVCFVQSYKIGCTLVKEKGSLLRNYTELGKNTVHLVKDQEKVLCLMWKMSKV